MNYGYMALVHREIMRIFRIWRQTFLPPMITSILYFEIFGRVLGSRMADFSGMEYTAYITPGMVMLNVIMASYSNTSFMVFAEKFHKGFTELLSAPISDDGIIFGFVAGSVFRSFICAFLILGVSLCFTSLPNINILGFVFVVFASTLVMGLLGLIFGFYARDFDEISFIPTFFLTPMTFLSGVFFPVADFGGVWGNVAMYNPMAGVCSVYRAVMLNTPLTYPWWMYCGLWFLISGFLWGVARWVMRQTNVIRT